MIHANMKINLPKNVKYIINTLQKSNYEAYIVGGAVRDSLLNREVHDYDITTDAKPEKTVEIFENLGYKIIPTGLKHGTVTILIDKEEFEVTTYRIDGEYEDSRRPKKVEFTSSLKEDLSRRDFTINAMAYNDDDGLVDYFHGLEDLNNAIIRCVGNPNQRFKEDALRMMRCIRFSSQLNYNIDKDSLNAIISLNENIKNISKERIREELCKILISDNAVNGINHLMSTGLIDNIIPELKACMNFNQHNIHHDKDVLKHILSVVEFTPPILELRLAALLHDIGKPKCFTLGEDGQGHFYEHNKASADISREILTRLKFDNKTINKVCSLVYEHMLTTKMKKPGIKRLLSRIGKENIDLLIQLCIADRKGTAAPYQDYSDLLELRDRIDNIISNNEPFNIKDLHINGKDLIQLGIKPGKEIGLILDKLLELVLENPKLNNQTLLIEFVKDIIK